MLTATTILPQGNASFNATGVDSSWTGGGFSMKCFWNRENTFRYKYLD